MVAASTGTGGQLVPDGRQPCRGSARPAPSPQKTAGSGHSQRPRTNGAPLARKRNRKAKHAHVFSRRKRCPSQGVGPSVAHHRLGGQKFCGLRRESNPGPLAPEARIIPLDHEAGWAFCDDGNFSLHGPMAAAQPVQRRDATCVVPAGAQHRAGRACRRAARPRCWCARRLAAPETLRPPRALGTAPHKKQVEQKLSV